MLFCLCLLSFHVASLPNVTQNMMASRYLATFEEEITGWQKSLATVAEVLLSLTEIQRKWSYLEPLFM